MNQKTGTYRTIALLCGIAGLAGFFIFPVLQLQGNLWNESLASYLESLGSENVHSFSASRFLVTLFGDQDPSYYNSIAQFVGFHNAAEVIFQYTLPTVGSFGLIVFGLMGGKAGGGGIILSGIINVAGYAYQIAAFPDSFSLAYEFSFWQYLLLALSGVCILLGAAECSQAAQSTAAAQPEQGSFPPEKDLARPENGALWREVGPEREEAAGKTQGALIGLSGEYRGASIPIQPGERITIGRDAASCNLILRDSSVSRVHCYVTYDGLNGDYSILDVSRYGVFDELGNPIERNVEVAMRPGKRIQIGKSQDVFTLG